jgi:hypothetical protein
MVVSDKNGLNRVACATKTTVGADPRTVVTVSLDLRSAPGKYVLSTQLQGEDAPTSIPYKSNRVRRKFSQKQLLPARAMGLDKNVGTIELGKHADMDADPLADIRNTRRIVKSISAGAVYDSAPLWESVDFKP